jgi:beta-aspartyl-peptidase (threonine type)
MTGAYASRCGLVVALRLALSSLMRSTLVLAAACAAAFPMHAQSPQPSASSPEKPYGLVIHGGAGVIRRDRMTPEREAEYRAKLKDALDAGYAVLDRGGPALDAVIAAVTILEDSPLFNAGKGAVFNADGICELDAAIMNGRTLQAGAIAGVRTIRNPLRLARDVMEKSPHVMMIGEGAEKFADTLGYERVPNEYFHTEFRRQQLRDAQAQEKAKAGGSAALPATDFSSPGVLDDTSREQKYGTVGCVALDRQGNLAAGTSTGGMTNKKFGRVGDVPVIGAGTYASNATCAVSATGWGEFFIRATVAHDISAQMQYQQKSVGDAARATLARVKELGGDGGVVCIDAKGNVSMDFNSAGMYRGYRVAGRGEAVAIYDDETRASEPAKTDADRRTALQSTVFGARREFFDSPTHTLARLESHATTLRAGEIAHPPHRHADEELIVVHEGTLEVTINEEKQTAGKGSLFFFASGDLHGMRNAGNAEATYQVIRIFPRDLAAR